MFITAVSVLFLRISLSYGQITIQRETQLVLLILSHWIILVIYLVDIATQPLNNRGQIQPRSQGPLLPVKARTLGTKLKQIMF